MEFVSIENKELVLRTLQQMRNAITQLKEWNKDITDINQWLCSPYGMQGLAANCMLIEAIGEGVKQIEKRSPAEFLASCPDTPWQEIKAMRNHIAHGYFDIDAEFVLSVVKNDLTPLDEALSRLESIAQKS